jgi:hypothetical protein
MRLPKGLSILVFGDFKIGKLYQTNIVEVHKLANCIVLRNGGWPTKHTKKCTNLIIQDYGLRLIQKDFQWYVVKQDGTKIAYQDDMKIAI